MHNQMLTNQTNSQVNMQYAVPDVHIIPIRQNLLSGMEAWSRQSPSTVQNPGKSIWNKAGAQISAVRNNFKPKCPTYVHKYSARKCVPGCAQVIVLEGKQTHSRPSTYSLIGQGRKENQRTKENFCMPARQSNLLTYKMFRQSRKVGNSEFHLVKQKQKTKHTHTHIYIYMFI